MVQSSKDNEDIVCLALRDAMTYCNTLINDPTNSEEDRTAFQTRKDIYNNTLSQIQESQLLVTTASAKIKGDTNDLHAHNKLSNEIRSISFTVNIDNSGGVDVQSISCEPATTSKSNVSRNSTTDKVNGKRKVRAKPKPTVRGSTKSGLRSKDNKRKLRKV